MAARVAGSSSGDGASSMTFWLRRWIEHSRSPRWITWPCLSPNTWISMWRGSTMNFSIKKRWSPNGDFASALASWKPSATAAPACGTRGPGVRDQHALAAAAGGGLDHHGIADLVGDLHRVLVVADDAEMARHGRDLCFRRGLFPFDLVPHRGDRARVGADEDDAGLGERARKRFTLRQKSVTGMHGFRGGLP